MECCDPILLSTETELQTKTDIKLLCEKLKSWLEEGFTTIHLGSIYATRKCEDTGFNNDITSSSSELCMVNLTPDYSMEFSQVF